MLQRLAEWDDEKELEKGKELFHVDRTRWRAQRKAFRAREIQSDRRDAELEAQQLASLQKESEAFLDKQAEMFAQMSDGNKRKAGGQIEESAPIKLSLAERERRKAEAKPTELPKPAAFGLADDYEDLGKRKRELIPLTYSDDEGEDEEEKGMSDQQKVERRVKKMKELAGTIPSKKEDLWAYEIRWDKITEKMLSEKVAPFTAKKVVEAVGTEEEELVTAVLDHLRAHGSAQALVDELEPVLEDEAVDFVIKIWRLVIFESLAAIHRIQTTAV